MPPASLIRRARASLVCAVVAGACLPAAAHAAVSRDPDAQAWSSRVRAGAAAQTPPQRTVERLGGVDQYASAVASSRAAFPDADSTRPDTVYLVSGEQDADALSVGPVVVARGGGLLLTRVDELPDETAAELRRLAPDHVVVVGGSGVVEDDVLDEVRALGPSVERVAGDDPYATSAALARKGFPSGARTVWVATGRSYADALAAAPAAAADGGPVVLVDGRAASLTTETRELLTDLGATTVRIAGSTTSVSEGVEEDLRRLVGRSDVTRAAGPDRYATSVAVNDLAFPSLEPGDAYVSSGTDFADSLSAGVAAGRAGRPLYLSVPYCAKANTATALRGPDVTRIRLVGGPQAVRGLVGTLQPCRSLVQADSLWVVPNKQRPLDPVDYAPTHLVAPRVATVNGHPLRVEAARALESMVAAARAEGAGRLALLSGYRSYDTQLAVHRAEERMKGSAGADRVVARPGYSEHQLGLGIDLTPLGDADCNDYRCIGSTEQGRWLAANAPRFGFVMRYEKGRTATTGYSPEPWHFRYVGKAVAQDYQAGGFHTLEEYFGLPAAPGY